MPKARDRTAVSVKVGVRTSVRTAWLRSRRQVSIQRRIIGYSATGRAGLTLGFDGNTQQMVGGPIAPGSPA